MVGSRVIQFVKLTDLELTKYYFLLPFTHFKSLRVYIHGELGSERLSVHKINFQARFRTYPTG